MVLPGWATYCLRNPFLANGIIQGRKNAQACINQSPGQCGAPLDLAFANGYKWMQKLSKRAIKWANRPRLLPWPDLPLWAGERAFLQRAKKAFAQAFRPTESNIRITTFTLTAWKKNVSLLDKPLSLKLLTAHHHSSPKQIGIVGVFIITCL